MQHDKIFEAPDSVVAQIARLPTMDIGEIKSLWQKLFGKPAPTHVRTFLERRLAYRLQEMECKRHNPKLIESNQRRIQAIINTAKRPLRDRYPEPVPGTVLTRVYRDKAHTVTITHDKQYEYSGRLYGSLSVIAREITGTRWSGPLFFGLRKATDDSKRKRSKK